ncbi:hypothetical protein T4D_15861 [Trichinella pseudospiralis]|uniref:Uncharacterized protein n=1 Tax=Trichinella pseudospiralis TaxID=6337 RepID=A0A0V1FEV8_TRIPS|nr:hypothetical protein T4D_15861 [Trichinella pseudospiralis]
MLAKKIIYLTSESNCCLTFLFNIEERFPNVTTIAIRRVALCRYPQGRGNKTYHPAQFKDAAGEDRGWLLVTDLHDPPLFSRSSGYPLYGVLFGH